MKILKNNTYSISKTLSLTLALFLSTIFSFSQEKNTQNITVTIENVKNDTGKVVVSLHTENTFMKSDAIQTTSSKIENGKITITFKEVTPGTYGIIALHDENENNRMDYDNTRRPIESYGISNNPMSYGPPQFSEAKFELKNEDLDFKIRF